MLGERSNIPAWKIKFWKLLYRLYRSNNGAVSTLEHRITPLGYLVAICLVFAIALRLGSGSNVLFAIISCLAATMICSFIFVFFRRAKVQIKRSLPNMATVGQHLHYFVDVQSKQLMPINSAFLRELSSGPVPSEDVFVYSVEPGEEVRNAFDRLFIVYRWKWLTGARTGFSSKKSNPLQLASKSSKKIRMTLVPKRRGMLDISNMRILLPESFQLFQRCVSVTQEHDSILVLPKRYRIRNLEILGEAQNQTGGEAQSRNIGHSSEFVSLRDYRPGDPIKHVDWKSWAKTGSPVIREYEDVYYPRHGLVLDTGLHPLLHAHFEEAVSVAASFACSLDTEEGLLDLVLIQQDAKVVTVGKGIERLDHMLEVLACADIETNPNWDDLTRSVVRLAPDFSGCIMVFGDWSKERADLVNQVTMVGTKVVCLLVYSDHDEVTDLLEKYGCATEVYLLKVGQIQQDLDLALESV